MESNQTNRNFKTQTKPNSIFTLISPVSPTNQIRLTPDGPILNRECPLDAASFLIIHRPFLERALSEIVVTTMDC